VVTNWDGLDAKAFAGIYNSNWVCSVHEQKQSFSPTEKKFNFCVEINKINIVIMPARFDLKQLFL
jgi:hypothetical protein